MPTMPVAPFVIRSRRGAAALLFASLAVGCTGPSRPTGRKDGAATGDWTVFWRGLAEPHVLPAVATALALKPTFPLRVYPKGRLAEAAATEQPQLK